MATYLSDPRDKVNLAQTGRRLAGAVPISKADKLLVRVHSRTGWRRQVMQKEASELFGLSGYRLKQAPSEVRGRCRFCSIDTIASLVA